MQIEACNMFLLIPINANLNPTSMKKQLFFLLAFIWAVNVLGQKSLVTDGPLTSQWGNENLWEYPTMRLLPGFGQIQVPGITVTLRTNCEMLFLGTDIYYINTSNQVCRLHYANGTWTANSPLVAGSTVIVASSTQLVSNGSNEVYFVGQEGTGGAYHVYSINVQGGSFYYYALQTATPGTATQLTYHFSQAHRMGQLFYYGTDYAPVLIQGSGTTWAYNFLNGINCLKMREGSKAVVANTDKFYYISHSSLSGSNHDKICEVFEWENAWYITSPLNPYPESPTYFDPFVQAGIDLSTDGWALFYVGATYHKLNGDYWNTVHGWSNQIVSVDGMPLPKLNVQITAKDNNLYYVGDYGSVNYPCYMVRYGSTWTGTVLRYKTTGSPYIAHEIEHPGWVVSNFNNWEYFQPVREGASLVIWDNPVYEDGTTQQFSSHHLFYPTPDNKIAVCIYDISCLQECEPFNQNFCTACLENQASEDEIAIGSGYKKMWYYKTLFDQSAQISAVSKLHGRIDPSTGKASVFFFRGTGTGNLWYLDRKVVNPVSKSGWTLAYQDEFNSGQTLFGTDNQVKWNPQTPSSNGYWKMYYEFFLDNNQNPNTNSYSFISANGTDYLSLIAHKVQPFQKTDWGWSWKGQYASCNTAGSYSITSGAIQSDWLNCKYPWDYSQQGNTACGPGNKSKKFTYKYGWNEFRGRTPRAKEIWPTLWSMPETDLYAYSMNMFEISGNGRAWLASNVKYPASENKFHSFLMYPIGFRYYDDFYTYATDWRRDVVDFYFNNELQGTINSSDEAGFGFIGTATGLLYKSMDHGNTWSQITNVPYPVSGYDLVQFYNEKEGAMLCQYGGSSYLMRFIDGGNTWDHFQFAGTGLIKAFAYHTKFHVMAGGATGDIYESWDGGLSFLLNSPMTITGTPKYPVNAMDFAYRGYAACNNGLILRYNSDQGVESWVVSKSSETQSGTNLNAIMETSFRVAYATGDNGRVFKKSYTDPAHEQWVLQTTGVTNHLRAMNFLDDYTGIIVGDGGCILRTANGGISWTATNITGGSLQNPGPNLNGVEMISYTLGYISSATCMYMTTDGGVTWTAIANTNLSIRGFSFPYPHSVPNEEMYIMLHNEKNDNTAVCEQELTTASLDVDYIRFYSLGGIGESGEDEDGPMGVSSQSGPAKDVTVYPNPSVGTFNVILPSVEENVVASVENATGMTVAGSSYQNVKSFVIDLSGKPAGIYFLRIISGDMNRVVKLMKK
jgi:hypothetical protein